LFCYLFKVLFIVYLKKLQKMMFIAFIQVYYKNDLTKNITLNNKHTNKKTNHQTKKAKASFSESNNPRFQSSIL